LFTRSFLERILAGEQFLGFFLVGRKNDFAAAAEEEEQQGGAGTLALYACLIAAENFHAAAVAVSCAHRYGGKKCQSCD